MSSKRTRSVEVHGPSSKKSKLTGDYASKEVVATLPVQFNDDLLLMVFSWLDGRSLLLCLAVSRRFRAVGMLESLWKALLATEFACFQLTLASAILPQPSLVVPEFTWKSMYHRCRRFLIRKCHVKNCHVYAEAVGRSNLKVCADCRAVSYCSKEHQRLDWRASHRAECGVLSRTRMFDSDPCMRDARTACPLCREDTVAVVNGPKSVDYFCTHCRLFSARVPCKRRPSEAGNGFGQPFVQVGAMLPGGGNVMVGVGAQVPNLPPNLLAGAVQAALGGAALQGVPLTNNALGQMLMQALMNGAAAAAGANAHHNGAQ
eukprot:TRINITY_DN10070_c0_g1_i2.p1 TRINITY_DN10070_c0_g1~~TRINITY_DN10070_c0_g1_i2.p1  ORF type:complete len:317 (-),score=66.59 TRINITY_DN10070_c0_g1_i2:771-1721(-)